MERGIETFTYRCIFDGNWLGHCGRCIQLIIEIESIAMSPDQEIPRVASNSMVNAVFLRPSETYV